MMNQQNRITKEKVLLKPFKRSIEEFFEGRSKKIDENNPYISAIYQDDNPALAVCRDRYEKDYVSSRLSLTQDSKVLDVGCGIGRWADAISHKIAHYVGIDFSEPMIEQAKVRHFRSSVDFYVMAAQDISPDTLGVHSYFDKVIISGILLYMDDNDIISFFSKIPTLLVKDALFYIREPLALNERLTLKGVLSKELKQKYYAIYRTKNELVDLVIRGLGVQIDCNFEMLFKDVEMNNRQETQQFYSIFNF
jgi:cyclopropane fatty-acyl-phospholipid synthase-like methyltransferase